LADERLTREVGAVFIIPVSEMGSHNYQNTLIKTLIKGRRKITKKLKKGESQKPI